MQPLALQKSPILADAGDAATSSAASQGLSGTIFNDVLASVTSKAQNAAGDAARRGAADAEGQQPDEAEQDVAALTAASQLASRGVVMKAAPVSAEMNLTNSTAVAITFEMADGNQVADVANGRSARDGEDKVLAKTEADVTKTVGLANTDGLNVQALIQLAATASITVADPQVDTKAVVEADGEFKPDAEATPLPIDVVDVADLTDAEKGSVEFLTSRTNSDTEMSAQVTDELTATPEQFNQPPKIAALQAVAWFRTGGAASTAGEEAEASDGHTESDAASQTDLLETAASSETDDETDANAQYASQAQPVGADPAALAMVNVAPMNGATPEQNPQQHAPDDLVLRQPSPQPNWQDSADRKGANSTRSYGATQDAATAVRMIGQTGHDATASALSDDSRNGDRSPSQTFVRSVEASTGQGSEIRDLAEVSLTTTLQNTNIDTLAADVAVSEAVAKQPGGPNRAKNKAELPSSEADGQVKGEELAEAHVSGGVHIRELLKLGVADVALSHEAPPLPLQAQAEATQPVAAQEVSNNLTAPPQAATAASSNVENNGERRTIAEDIRLRALERMVVNAVRNGTQTLSIQLYPPGLGQVMLRLAMDGPRLRLTSRASTTEAAETLRNMETDLRSALAGNGVHLAGFDVSEDGPNDDAPRRQPAEPVVKTRNGGTDESFTVELNA